MPKVHFNKGCGRGTGNFVTDNVNRVTCRTCGSREAFIDAKAKAEAEKMEAFLAQEPRAVKEPWRDGNIECTQCGWDLFRMTDRTCYGHYDNWVCAACGYTESRLTETGMSF